TCAGSSPWKYTSVRLQVDRIAASLTVCARLNCRSASPSASGANATRSRTSSGAVVWLRPRAKRDMSKSLYATGRTPDASRGAGLGRVPSLRPRILLRAGARMIAKPLIPMGTPRLSSQRTRGSSRGAASGRPNVQVWDIPACRLRRTTTSANAAACEAPDVCANMPLRNITWKVPMIRILGHRGGRELWPENSLQGFRNAIALGVDAVEFDVHLSADDEVMVMHDPSLDRTTTGDGLVRDKTAAELSNFKHTASTE